MLSCPISLSGEFTSSCGYCGGNEEKENSKSVSFGFHFDSTSTEKYLQLLNCGWRRSGKFFYLLLNEKTCCPAQTIRTECVEFVLNRKSHKKVIKRIAHLIGIRCETWDFVECLSTILEAGKKTGKFTIETEQAKLDVESWKLYKKYQIAIHKDLPASLTETRYQRFLCDSPLPTSSTMHQKYFIDGHLVAVSVVDLLPECLSSVYFFYDPDYSHLTLGIFSALYEIYHARCILHVPYYYMGYYIKNCPKMTYKSQFEPCFLLNRVTQQWTIFNEVQFDEKGSVIFPSDRSAIDVGANLSNYEIQFENKLQDLQSFWDCFTSQGQSLILRFIKHVKNIPFTINVSG